MSVVEKDGWAGEVLWVDIYGRLGTEGHPRHLDGA